MTARSGIRAARGHSETRLRLEHRRVSGERLDVMSVAPLADSQSSTVHPVPKPKRRRSRPVVRGRAAHRLAAAQGHAYEDIAADLEATDAIEMACAVDRRRDPLIVEMVRLFSAIRRDLNSSAASCALATRGAALGCEAIRLDQIIGEHDDRARQQTLASADAGRAVVAIQESLLTGRKPAEAVG